MSGFPRASAPGGPAGGGLSGTYPDPSVNYDEQFTIVTSAVNILLASWNRLVPTAALTATLPAAPGIGDQVALDASSAAGAVVLAANAGQTINGVASLTFNFTSGLPNGSVTVIYEAANTWRLISASNTDGGLGFRVGGALAVAGQMTAAGLIAENAGIQSNIHAAFTAPAITSAVAFTPNVSFDTVVQINLAATTLGTLAVTYGPTTGTENTWLPSANAVAGSDLISTLYVPAGWKVVATATGVTVALSASVHRI